MKHGSYHKAFNKLKNYSGHDKNCNYCLFKAGRFFNTHNACKGYATFTQMIVRDERVTLAIKHHKSSVKAQAVRERESLEEACQLVLQSNDTD